LKTILSVIILSLANIGIKLKKCQI